MKNASQWALVSPALVLGIAYACATPEEIRSCQQGSSPADCDVLLVQASEFESPDASLPGAQGGSNGSSPSGGSSGASSTPPAGGAAGTGSPPPGGSAGQGAAGSGAGAGGASGGAAGSGAGTGGVAGTAGSGGTAGTAGTSGAGGTTGQSNFDPAACNFANRAGCDAQACATACPQGMGFYCRDNCLAIIDCVATAPTPCVTAQDPMCGTPSQNPFTPNTCTDEVNSSGSPTTAGTPASVALALMNCLCDDTRL